MMKCREVMELNDLAAGFTIDSRTTDTLATGLVADWTNRTTHVTTTSDATMKVGSIQFVETILAPAALSSFNVTLARTSAAASYTNRHGGNRAILTACAFIAATWIVKVQSPVTRFAPLMNR